MLQLAMLRIGAMVRQALTVEPSLLADPIYGFSSHAQLFIAAVHALRAEKEAFF